MARILEYNQDLVQTLLLLLLNFLHRPFFQSQGCDYYLYADNSQMFTSSFEL